MRIDLTRPMVLALAVVLSLLITACGEAAPAGGDGATPEDDGQADTTGPGPDADPELVRVYEEFVQAEIPGLPFEVLEAAKDEGKVVWYHLRIPGSTVPLLESFQEQFPFIRVEEYEDSGPPLFERFITEARARSVQADLMQFANKALVTQALEEGYLQGYTATSNDQFDERFIEAGSWYPSGLSTRIVYLYNTNLVDETLAESLTRYESLWTEPLPERGIAVLDGAGASNGQLYFYFIEKEFGEESWKRLAERSSPMIAASTPAADAVARGEVAVALASESIATNLYESGAPVRWTAPDPVLVEPWPLAISKDAPNPNAARLLYEFALSKHGQEIFAQTGLPSARKDVDVEPEVASEPWFPAYSQREYYEIDQEDYEARLPEITERFKQVFQ